MALPSIEHSNDSTGPDYKKAAQLYAAVMHQAIHELTRWHKEKRLALLINAELARRWILGLYDDCAIAFVDCCDVLGLNPDIVRAQLTRQGILGSEQLQYMQQEEEKAETLSSSVETQSDLPTETAAPLPD